MNRFENKWYKGVIPYSRIIASYAKYENPRGNLIKFKGWLDQIKELDKEAKDDIIFLVTNGKLELEENAKRYLKETKLNRATPNVAKPNRVQL